MYPAYADSIIAKHVCYRSEWFDWDLLHFLESYLQPGDHFVDIGANTGLHTLLASTRIDASTAGGGRLTLIEPHPVNLARLRHALELNSLLAAPGLTLHALAASDTAGEQRLDGDDVFARLSPLSHLEPVTAPVPTVRLDDLLHDLCAPGAPPVHACKIDVEGAEWQVLRGATRLIHSGSLPVLILEFRGHLEVYGGAESDFIDWLRQTGGYRLARYEHDTATLHLDPAPPFPDEPDLLAVTPAGLDLIRSRLPSLRVAPAASS